MRTITLILGLVAVPVAHGQSWCPPGATWLFDTGSPWSVSQTRLTYSGDTVVDGFTSQRIDRLFRLVESFGIDTLVEAHSILTTRTDGDVVWDKVDGVWDTLFWFGAVPSDQWQPTWPFGEQCPDQTWFVADTSTAVLDGVPLRTLDLELHEAGIATGMVSSITERIGGGLWQSLPPCGAICECYCSFICYQDNDISNPIDSCEFTLGLQEQDLSSIGQLGLLAEDGVLTVQVPDELVGGIMRIHDAMGREVFSAKVSALQTDYPTQGFAPGAYSVLVVNGPERRSARVVLP